jgi:hypothetical protein
MPMQIPLNGPGDGVVRKMQEQFSANAETHSGLRKAKEILVEDWKVGKSHFALHLISFR